MTTGTGTGTSAARLIDCCHRRPTPTPCGSSEACKQVNSKSAVARVQPQRPVPHGFGGNWIVDYDPSPVLL